MIYQLQAGVFQPCRHLTIAAVSHQYKHRPLKEATTVLHTTTLLMQMGISTE
jgi:hypothetical protein